jgi:hypothetical protein
MLDLLFKKIVRAEAGWPLWQCGNCHEDFFLRMRDLFLRMRGILKKFSENLIRFSRYRLKTFPEKLRLFFKINVRVFQRLHGFLNSFLVELRLL